jgi:hypothetical protein
LNRGARDTRRAGLQLGTGLEFYRGIHSGPVCSCGPGCTHNHAPNTLSGLGCSSINAGPVCTHNLGSMGDGLQLVGWVGVRSRDPLRDGLQLRAGMQFDRGIHSGTVCSCGPGCSSIEGSTSSRFAAGDRVGVPSSDLLRAGLQAQTTHRPRTSGRVETYLPPTNGGWMRKKTV